MLCFEQLCLLGRSAWTGFYVTCTDVELVTKECCQNLQGAHEQWCSVSSRKCMENRRVLSHLHGCISLEKEIGKWTWIGLVFIYFRKWWRYDKQRKMWIVKTWSWTWRLSCPEVWATKSHKVSLCWERRTMLVWPGWTRSCTLSCQFARKLFISQHSASRKIWLRLLRKYIVMQNSAFCRKEWGTWMEMV